MSSFERLDFLMLKGFGASAVETGLYGAAQNFAAARFIALLALSPPLVASLTRLHAEGRKELAGPLAADALSSAFLPLPLLVAAVIAAPEILGLVFGARYVAAAPWLQALLLSTMALFVSSICGSLITSAGRPGTNLAIAAPLVPAALVLHAIAIPTWGPAGAASVTLALSTGAAATAVLVAARAFECKLPLPSLLRACALSVVAGGLAWSFKSSGLLLLVQLGALGLLLAPAYAALGEPLARSLLRRLRQLADPKPTS